MTTTAVRVTEKMHGMTDDQLVEVEQYIDQLRSDPSDRAIVGAAIRLSEKSLAFWSDSEEDVYDAL